MQFHHLVEINDPFNPLLDPLTRDQLWRGLVMRAEDPKFFMPHLEQCELSDRSAESVHRILHYGNVSIRDKVVYVPQVKVMYEVPPQTDIVSSRLTMTIEEPEVGRLLVRFDYEDDAPEISGGMDAFYNEFRQSAYKEADLDTIGLIRELAADGRLG